MVIKRRHRKIIKFGLCLVFTLILTVGINRGRRLSEEGHQFELFKPLRDYIQTEYLPDERVKQGKWPVKLTGLRNRLLKDIERDRDVGADSYYKRSLDYFDHHDLNYTLDSA